MGNEKRPSKVLHVALWIVQGLLAISFGLPGVMKLFAPIEQLAQSGMTFVTSYSEGMVRFIGISEILGAIGLILPAALRIIPQLTPLAATGIAIIMVLATRYHVLNDEPFVPAVILFVMAVFVIWGRVIKAPIVTKKQSRHLRKANG